jgi:hypothetical protein
MEGLLFAGGIGGLVVSGSALLYGFTYGKAYVDRLGSAIPATLPKNQPNAFVYLNGRLACDDPVAILKTPDKFETNNLYCATMKKFFDLQKVFSFQFSSSPVTISTRKSYVGMKYKAGDKLSLSGWDISDFVSALEYDHIDDVYENITNGFPDISVKTTSDLIQIIGKQLQLTETYGVKYGEYYTIFGVADNFSVATLNGYSFPKLNVCPEYGYLVFRNKTATQVTTEAKQFNDTWNWSWGVIGCLSGIATFAGTVSGYSSKQ